MRNFLGVVATVAWTLFTGVNAFAPSSFSSSSSLRISSSSTPTAASSRRSTERSALWRRWIPGGSDEGEVSLVDASRLSSPSQESSQAGEPVDEDDDDERRRQHHNAELDAKNVFLGSLLSAALMVYPATDALAVSGGGLDFAGLDISGQDYSKNSYKGKDFTQVIAKATTFASSNLQGCRFYKSYLVNADFTDADLTGASLEGTSMDGASLKNAIVKGTYFSKSLLDTQLVENADFTDAQFPPKVLPILCEREDMKGSNPTTGADTRDSAMCP